MTKEVAILLDDKEELEVLRSKFKIEEERFVQGIMFVDEILKGNKPTASYINTFNVDKETARRQASGFHRSKWIQELIKYLRPDDQSLYIGEIKAIIARGMEIVNNPRSSNSEITGVMKALAPYIKAQEMKQINELNLTVNQTEGSNASQKLNDNIKLLAQSGKMVDKDGEIIDVTVIE